MAKAETKKSGASSKPEGSEQPQFGIQRIYTKDISFESPAAPKVFLEQWQPELDMNLGTKTLKLEDETHEVVLTVTVTVKMKDKAVFVAEVHQAGIFTIQHFPEDQLKHMLGSFCPNILYPYAREAITDLVIKGGFPQLYLAPINFEALYQQQMQQGGQGSQTSASA